MKKITIILNVFICIGLSKCQINNDPDVSLQFDGSKKIQQIDGFGVNVHTHSWRGKELEPALELLLDSMNATIWRVIIETVVMWEDVNDNDDPFTFNWVYYNKLYETPKFEKAWDMIQYLNSKGITNNLMINFMGPVPSWMGMEENIQPKLGGDVIEPEYEDEYVEMLVSFFYYARNVKHLEFGLVSPFNETDLNGKEGPRVGPRQYVRILKKLIDRMQNVGLGNIQYVAPDVASMNRGINSYLPELMADPVIMSQIAHVGLHSYSGYYADVSTFIKESAYPEFSFWITEWNAWRNGLDDGQIGLYNYKFASECVNYLLELLKNGATAALVWEGYDSYYEHHYPSTFSYWGILGYSHDTKTYSPRKHLYAISQVSKFVLPGSWQIAVNGEDSSLVVLAFYDIASGRVSITGINKENKPKIIKGELANLPDINRLEFYYTDSVKNLYRDKDIEVKEKSFKKTLPAKCIFTFTGKEMETETASTKRTKPEPPDWYAGDMHVHRNCGDDSIVSVNRLFDMMKTNDLNFISLLADMGNTEVKPCKIDLPKVNGKDAPESKPGQIMHWDAEWHWDATYSQFENQALGGHLVFLGLKEAHQIWDESLYRILEWAKKQNAICGFAHMQYLNDKIQNELNCCIPIDYPVEAALGTIDFISEDVHGSEPAMSAYYKLLNCGFRIGLAAGTDYPCNAYEPLGSLLTYVQIRNAPVTYRRWIEGIRMGNTVISRNGHKEFLELKVNDQSGAGDEIKFKDKGTVKIDIRWTAIEELTGIIELVINGKVVASQQGTVKPGKPLLLEATKEFKESGWICARRMNEKGHQSHTAAVYITVNEKPVRASADDAEYFIAWIDNILKNIAPGGPWNHYYTHDLDEVKNRYERAKQIYIQIAEEAKVQIIAIYLK